MIRFLRGTNTPHTAPKSRLIRSKTLSVATQRLSREARAEPALQLSHTRRTWSVVLGYDSLQKNLARTRRTPSCGYHQSACPASAQRVPWRRDDSSGEGLRNDPACFNWLLLMDDGGEELKRSNGCNEPIRVGAALW